MKAIMGLIATYLFFLLTYLIRMSPAAMAPEIIQTYHYNAFGFSLMSASFYYLYALMQIPAGYCVDRFGCRKTLTLSALICVIALVMQATADSKLIEDLSRAILGAACATGSIIMVKVIGEMFDTKLFSILFAIGFSLGLSGSLISQMPLVELVDSFGYTHTLFLIAAGCALVLFMALLFVSGRTSNIEAGGDRDSFMQLFVKRNVWACGITLGLQSVPMAAFAALWGPTYFKYGFALDEITATSHSQVFFIGAILGSLIIGALASHLGLRKSLLYMSSIVAFSVCVYWLLDMKNLDVNVIALAILGLVSINVVTTSIIRETIPVHSLGLAYGIVSTWSQLICAGSQTLFGYVLQQDEVTTGSSLLLRDFFNPLFILPASMLLSLVFIYLTKAKDS